MKKVVSFAMFAFFSTGAVAEEYVICQGRVAGDWQVKCSPQARQLIKHTLTALDGRGEFDYLSVVSSNHGYAVSMTNQLEVVEGRRGGGDFSCQFDKRRVLTACAFNR